MVAIVVVFQQETIVFLKYRVRKDVTMKALLACHVVMKHADVRLYQSRICSLGK